MSEAVSFNPKDQTNPASAPRERYALIERKTRESEIRVELALDGTGKGEIATGIGFLDHMLTAIARHGFFDLSVSAKGDLWVDSHHTAEDVGIALGRAFDQALGHRRGIVRIAHAYAPLDEALARVVVDLSGRGYPAIFAEFSTPKIGDMDTDLVVHIFESLAIEGKMSLHAEVLRGRNDHHKAEALFKALARALDLATRSDERLLGESPSTKGVLG